MTETAAVLEDLVGVRTVSRDCFQIGREAVRAFATAVNEPNPLCWNEAAAAAAGHPGLQAPLTFSALMGGPEAQEDLLPPGYSLSQVLHVEQRHVYHRPMYVGDRVWRVAGLESFRLSDRADQLVLKTDFVAADGTVLQEVWVTLLARRGAVDPQIAAAAEQVMFGRTVVDQGGTPGPAVADLLVPEDRPAPGPAVSAAADWAAGGELPAKSYAVSRGNLVAYSGVAGDPNPIHFSDVLAQQAGLDDVVAQAMLTMAMSGSYLTGMIGDPAAVREFRARFTNPVYVPADAVAEVTFGGKVKTLDRDTGRGEFALTAVHGGRRVFGRCTALVDLR